MTVDGGRRMVVDKFEDLDAWQVADELRLEVYALTATGPASQDFKFCSQIRDAASSATRNISEGFGRYYPGDFAHFMDFGIASVMEIQDCLRDGVARKHFSTDRVRRAQSLTVRSLQVSKGLKRYLLSARRHPRWNHRQMPNDRRKPNDRKPRRRTNGRNAKRTTNDDQS
jgi:four helix bundle protein